MHLPSANKLNSFYGMDVCTGANEFILRTDGRMCEQESIPVYSMRTTTTVASSLVDGDIPYPPPPWYQGYPTPRRNMGPETWMEPGTRDTVPHFGQND